MVRALTSHQCGPDSIPGPGIICGWSLLLVLSLLQEVFHQVLRLSPPQKPSFVNSNSIQNSRATGLSVVRLLSVTLVKQSLFIYYHTQTKYTVTKEIIGDKKNTRSGEGLRRLGIFRLDVNSVILVTHQHLEVNLFQKERKMLLVFLMAQYCC